MSTDAKILKAITNAHNALTANVEAGNAASRRNAPRETLVYHLDLANKAVRNLRTLENELNLPAQLKKQAD